MKRYETQDIRNVVFVGHGGAGKTSLAEAILFVGKGTNRRGVAGTDSSNFDYEPEEIKRQHTIQVGRVCRVAEEEGQLHRHAR
jgi:elongation factor G